MQLLSRVHGILLLVTLMVVIAVCQGTHAQTFHIAEAIDIGSNLEPIGNLSWNYVLGTDWDQEYSIGGIIGREECHGHSRGA